MSMSCAVWQVAEETIDDVMNDPSIGKEVLEELKEYNDELPEDQKILLDIDKAWDGIHFLLGKKKPDIESNFLTQGGQELAAIDLGHDPARYFSPKEVMLLSKALRNTKFSTLRDGFRVSDLLAAKVYPFQEGEQDSDTFGYLETYWGDLVKFIDKTAAQGRGLMTYLY